MVFLILAAQYESWSLPFSVLLGTPIAVAGAFIALLLRGQEFNVYAQIGLVMLIGLAAKNAILIVEFAKMEHEKGELSLIEATLKGAQLRLRRSWPLPPSMRARPVLISPFRLTRIHRSMCFGSK